MGGAIVSLLSQWKQPVMKGSFKLKNTFLRGPVSIVRDNQGVPHITGTCVNDVLFGQGFVHAQERIFQMEILRRISTGTLSELLGEHGLEADIMSRTFGFLRLAQADEKLLSEKERLYLQAYCAGANEYLQSSMYVNPVEMTLAWAKKPNPFTVMDVLAFNRLLCWQMSYGWYTKLIKLLVREKLIDFDPQISQDALNEISIETNEKVPTTLPKGVNEINFDWEKMQKLRETMFFKNNQGSNAWVISGDLTETGKPFLCSDPHLEPSHPSIWFQNHLRSTCDSGLNAIGVSVPLTPFVLIGHTEKFANGITLAFTESSDLFLETLRNGENGPEVLSQKQWVPVQVFEEKIAIGNPSKRVFHTEKVMVTPHGAIINNLLTVEGKAMPKGLQHKFAFQATFLQPGKVLEHVCALNFVSSFQEFKDVIQSIEAPPLNIVYADEHSIGYAVTGRVPLRKQPHNGYPASGEGDYDWVGLVPPEGMPVCLNPESGFIVTCNHKLVDFDKSKYDLGTMFLNGNRAIRCTELITNKLRRGEKLTMKDMQDFQNDTTSVAFHALWKQIRPFLTTLENEDAKWICESFDKWDGNLHIDSIAASIYSVLRYQLVFNIFEKPLGTTLTHKVMGGGFSKEMKNDSYFTTNEVNMVLRMWTKGEESYFIKLAGGRQKLLEKTVRDTISYLSNTVGHNRETWKYGKIHTLTHPHPIGEKISEFNRGPYPIGGDCDTLNNMAIYSPQPYNCLGCYPSYRQIIDFSDINNSLWILPCGNSGHYGSPFYDDSIREYLDGKYRKMLFSEKDILANVFSTIHLTPEKH